MGKLFVRYAAILVGVLLLEPVSAKADAIFSFTGQLSGAQNGVIGFNFNVKDEAITQGLNARITGNFNGCDTSYTPPCITSGNIQDLISLNGGAGLSGIHAASTFAEGTYQFNVDFGPIGGSIDLLGVDQTLYLTGSGGSWTGTYSADGTRCGSDTPCYVSGGFSASVPEAPTWTLLGAILLMMGLSMIAKRVGENRA